MLCNCTCPVEEEPLSGETVVALRSEGFIAADGQLDFVISTAQCTVCMCVRVVHSNPVITNNLGELEGKYSLYAGFAISRKIFLHE